MASKFMRGNTWWIKARHPVTGKMLRESLDTADRAGAELLRQRIELELALQHPLPGHLVIPPKIYTAIGASHSHDSTMRAAVGQAIAATPIQRTTIEGALERYLKFIASENVKHHLQNKISMLRRFFGTARVDAVCKAALAECRPTRRSNLVAPHFAGAFIDEIDSAILQEFIDRLKVTRKTKRHYRELFHHLFEVWMRFDLYQPRNFHRPNPVSALPSYIVRNKRIEFLSADDIDKQLAALDDEPSIRMAVAIMIHAGPRRTEALWLQRGSLAPDLTFMSIVNRVDPENDEEGSLKTGERSVTILPPLRELLAPYLVEHNHEWLITTSKGKRWEPNSFSRKLRQLNQRKALRWTCLHYRHTYATQRAAEGWPLFRIAKEMGNSSAVVEQSYAAFVRPTG